MIPRMLRRGVLWSARLFTAASVTGIQRPRPAFAYHHPWPTNIVAVTPPSETYCTPRGPQILLPLTNRRIRSASPVNHSQWHLRELSIRNMRMGYGAWRPPCEQLVVDDCLF